MDFHKTCVCIGIMEIWFGIVNGQILWYFDKDTCPRHMRIFIFEW